MHYSLRCPVCGTTYSDEERPLRLSCGNDHEPALLLTEYNRKDFSIEDSESGLFRYRNWLPVSRSFPGAAGTVVYREVELGDALNLNNFYVAFNGYHPEIGASMETCSFKELEALSICGRMDTSSNDYMVVASAGNTGRSFLQIGSKYNLKVCIVVPESALPEMWTTVPKSDSVILITLADADYFDVIKLSHAIAGLPGYYPEGGAKNIARRDGMGSVVLAATDAIGAVPDHYLQAVGSGTGGVAAHEMATRLKATGAYGSTPMKLHLVQNAPFTIMHDAWRARSRSLPDMDEAEAKERIAQLWSPVLSNRKPPYSPAGGVFDVLTASNGETWSATTEEAKKAGRLYSGVHGITLDPAADVAFAGLLKAVETGVFRKDDVVLLNVTGGGAQHPELEKRKLANTPDIRFTGKETVPEITDHLTAVTV